MEYFINDDTLLLLSISANKTKVIEKNDTFIVNKNILEIIDESCHYFGSSYEGRLSGTKSLINMKYKLPIVIEESHELVLFPTASSRQINCSWIALQNIENYKRSNKKTVITFKNNVCVELDISYGSFESQIFRATLLLMTLRKHKKIS